MSYSIIFSNFWKFKVNHCKLWEKWNSHEKQYCYFLGVKALPWNGMCYKIIQIAKPKQKTTQKRSTLTARSNNVAVWQFFNQNWFFQTWPFSSLFYSLNFIFSEFCYISIKNFQKVNFLKSFNEMLFFADFEIFSCIGYFWTCPEPIFKAHASCYF